VKSASGSVYQQWITLRAWAAALLAFGWVPRPHRRRRGPSRLTWWSIAPWRRAAQLEAARQSAAAATARIGPARTLPDPQLQIGLMNRNLPGLGLQDPLGMNQIQLMQMIPTAGKLGLAGKVAAAQAAATGERTEDVRWELRSRAAMAFYDLYQLDHSLTVAVETQRLLRDLAKTTEAMYAVGDGRQPDVLRAQGELARMSEEIIRMQTMRVAMAARLNALLGQGPEVDVASPVLPAFPADLPPLDSLERLAQANRPMIRAGEQDLRAAESARRLARREIWPDLQVGVVYGQRPMNPGTDRMMSFMLGFSLPVFAGGRQLAMRRETEAMQRMAAADLDGMRADTRGRVAEALCGGGPCPQPGHALPDDRPATIECHRCLGYRSLPRRGVDFMTLLDARMTVNKYRQTSTSSRPRRGRHWLSWKMLVGQSCSTSMLLGDRPHVEAISDHRERCPRHRSLPRRTPCLAHLAEPGRAGYGSASSVAAGRRRSRRLPVDPQTRGWGGPGGACAWSGSRRRRLRGRSGFRRATRRRSGRLRAGDARPLARSVRTVGLVTYDETRWRPSPR
jgi:hypothetical protein